MSTVLTAAQLAAWWSRPTAAEREGWGAAPEDFDPEELLVEYERLFVGPGRAPCPPYESLWREDAPRRDRGRLMGGCAADVARIYGELGLQLRADAHELPDQLVVELEAFAYALEHGCAEAAAELAREHLALWLPAFCAAVEAETTQPFYAALARLTPEWAAALAA